MTGRGTLILVVGPSGVGKDSIIAGAAERLRADPKLVFARRVITRPPETGGENHVALSPAEFADWRNAGRFMLHWPAHGIEYGLPLCLTDALEYGRSVIANVSRTVVDEAQRRFPPVVVIAVAASPDTIAARLAARGRETAAEIERRLKRAGATPPFDPDYVIDNDGPLSAAVGRFADLVRQHRSQPVSG
jgi:phosphonate metabolism protein PhnN/1,5-bisphosphokinase (PRPP-forming)